MREILFRGKNDDNGEWVYSMCISRHAYEVENNEITSCYIGGGNITAKAETIGQFTGLTDKNGKKIFEGDIVKYGDTIHKVVFEQRNGTAYFGLVYSEIETLPFGHYQDLKQITIIGNIHDNPELLGGDS